MDFNLNVTQKMLRQSAREFLGKEYPDEALRRADADDDEAAAGLWDSMAGLGWMALAVPEVYGGIGDFMDLTIILEEMGRAGLVSPYFATVVLGGAALVEGGSGVQKQQLLPKVTEGRFKMTLAVAEAAARYEPESVALEAEPGGGGYTLNGVKRFVPYAGEADCIVCAARTDAEAPPQDISLLLVDAETEGITCRRLETAAGDRQYDVTFEDVKVPRRNLLGRAEKGGPALEKILAKAAVARCAEMLGAAERALEMTLEYAKERKTFGHPIGAYQSIQHRCADMLMDIEASRLVTWQAAWRLNEGLPAAREAAIAKAWVGPACRRVVTSAHQVHGAIGFTEDHVLHRFTRRIRAGEFSYGGADFHLEKLAEMSRPAAEETAAG